MIGTPSILGGKSRWMHHCNSCCPASHQPMSRQLLLLGTHQGSTDSWNASAEAHTCIHWSGLNCYSSYQLPCAPASHPWRSMPSGLIDISTFPSWEETAIPKCNSSACELFWWRLQCHHWWLADKTNWTWTAPSSEMTNTWTTWKRSSPVCILIFFKPT